MMKTKTISITMQETIQRCYRDLLMEKPQQIAFNRRQIGKPWPQTTAEASKVCEGLKAMLMRLFRPYYQNLRALIDTLYEERYDMTSWERDKFLPDVSRRLRAGKTISPQMIKKTREIAHKLRIAPGFPSFKDLARQHRQHREAARRERPAS